MPRGGKRNGAGRKSGRTPATTMIHCAIPKPAFERLQQLESERQIYHTRIAAQILTAQLGFPTLTPSHPAK